MYSIATNSLSKEITSFSRDFSNIIKITNNNTCAHLIHLYFLGETDLKLQINTLGSPNKRYIHGFIRTWNDLYRDYLNCWNGEHIFQRQVWFRCTSETDPNGPNDYANKSTNAITREECHLLHPGISDAINLFASFIKQTGYKVIIASTASSKYLNNHKMYTLSLVCYTAK